MTSRLRAIRSTSRDLGHSALCRKDGTRTSSRIIIYAALIALLVTIYAVTPLVAADKNVPQPLVVVKLEDPLSKLVLPIVVTGKDGRRISLRAAISKRTKLNSLKIDSRILAANSFLADAIGTGGIGFDFGTVEGTYYKHVDVRFADGARILTGPVCSFDFTPYVKYFDVDCNAIISLAHLEGYVIDFDGDSREVRLYEAEHFPATEGSLPVTVGEQLSVMVDLGFPSPIQCWIAFNDSMPLRIPLGLGQVLSEQEGLRDARSVSQMGPSGERIDMIRCEINRVMLGKVRFEKVGCFTYPQSVPHDTPLVGMGLLRRTSFTLNLGKAPSIAFRPLKVPPVASHPFDMTGINFLAEPNHLDVFGVEDKSPGEEAGVVAGDKIITVNSVPVSELGRYRLRKIFADTSKECTLKVQRDKKEFEVRLTPREFRPEYKFKPVDQREIPLDD